MKNLSIIIPYLNEDEYIRKTIASINETGDINRTEIIAIDDDSKNKVDLSDFKNVRQIRNEKRIGVDACRQMGVELASNEYCLILDAHMIFKNDDWLNKIVNKVELNPYTLWCCTCLGLGYGVMDVNKAKGKYHGANLLLTGENTSKNRFATECLEPKWAHEKPELEYEIPVILGANYFFNKKWFDYIGGLKGLKSWGSSEPFMSLKSFFAGGNSKITKEIEIGHVFRDDAPYVTQIADLYYNKIFICKTLFPKEIEDKILECLPKNINYKMAMEKINNDIEVIEKEKRYYSSIFKHNIYDFCSKFNIKI